MSEADNNTVLVSVSVPWHTLDEVHSCLLQQGDEMSNAAGGM